jgi:DNA modification methylase
MLAMISHYLLSNRFCTWVTDAQVCQCNHDIALCDEVVNGDCLSVLKTMDDDSFDAIVTDPPAGIAFMGKSWDKDKGGRDHWVAWMSEVAAECLRVAKPGAHALVWALPRTSHWTATAWEDGGWEVRDRVAFIFGTGFPKSLNIGDGRGTAIKPAVEDWWLLRKPLVGTVAENVEQFGTGAINIELCRVPAQNRPKVHAPGVGSGDRSSFDMGGGFHEGTTDLGRWPANLITDGSDEIAAMFPQSDGQAGSVTGEESSSKTNDVYGKFNGRQPSDPRGDSGSAARFFYGAKATRADREEGLEQFIPVRRSDGRAKDIENPRLRTTERRNHHPTVKPTSLMRYLCKLITPPGGHILDPFSGSGSTGKAAVFESFSFTGIEQDAEFCAIARARIAWAIANQKQKL